MKATVSLKNGNYFVTDSNTSKKIYTIRKLSFKTASFQLINESKYKLYTLTQEQMSSKPSFVISNNGVAIMKAVCTTLFLDPKINITGKSTNGEDVNYTLASTDRKNFDILCGDTVCGKLKTSITVSGELQYDMEISDKYFDDYAVFFAAIVDMSFGHLNRD